MSEYFECPICGRPPKIHTYAPDIATASCKGYGFHRHKKISVTIYSNPSELYKKLQNHWNQIWFREARFLYWNESDIERIIGPQYEEEDT